MRALEFLTEAVKHYYHGSRNDLPVGTKLTPQSEGYVVGTGMDEIEKEAHLRLEGILERYRPANAVPRHQAVFMTDNIQDIDNAGGYSDYVYVVIPIGHVTKCNLDWYSELFGLSFDEIDEKTAADLANKYWTAAPSPSATYEYLTPAAKIISAEEY